MERRGKPRQVGNIRVIGGCKRTGKGRGGEGLCYRCFDEGEKKRYAPAQPSQTIGEDNRHERRFTDKKEKKERPVFCSASGGKKGKARG